MAQIQIANFADSTLASSIAGGDTTVSFAATDPTTTFPALAAGDWFYAVLVDVAANREIIKVTAHTAGTRIFTVVRAQEGTGVTPDTLGLSFAVGSVISLRLTVQAFKDYVDAIALSVADIGVSVQAYDLETAKTDVAQTFTKPQTAAALALTSSTTWDGETYQSLTVDVNGSSFTVAAADHVPADKTYVGMFIKYTTTHSIAFTTGSAKSFSGVTSFVGTATAGKYDHLVFRYDLASDRFMLVGYTKDCAA